MVHDEEAARDLSQEAFLRVFRALRRFDPSRPFYPWFHQILRRLCLDHLRRRRQRVSLEVVGDRLVGADARSVSRRLERQEARQRVLEAMEKLSESDREILVLREFQGCTYREIAEILGIPRGTVMSRLYYARRRLRALLEPLFDPGGGGKP
jgi:RNA polymerase sigma-70 factor (ECF subfamily)